VSGQEARSAAQGQGGATISRYPTELVDCDRCDGMGEVEDDLWVWTRCYSCWGRGMVEVCAQCHDDGEECDACGC
jgi:DnaJ-class molecular chaperone